jgi:LmbE family N-acetylglucosaminyl deacetylase
VGRRIRLKKKVLVAVAHPDDETLWCGGTLLTHPDWDLTIFALTRKSDPDRAPKFFKVVSEYGAAGIMADLDDGPGQKPLSYKEYKTAFTENINDRAFDTVITHAPFGEYTRHLRHEELSQAVSGLLFEGIVESKEIWFFWYSDENGKELPSARSDSDFVISLNKEIFQQKSHILFDIYGFSMDSWEGRTLPRVEGFKIRQNLLKR